ENAARPRSRRPLDERASWVTTAGGTTVIRVPFPFHLLRMSGPIGRSQVDILLGRNPVHATPESIGTCSAKAICTGATGIRGSASSGRGYAAIAANESLVKSSMSMNARWATLLAAACRAPSGDNRQPWRFEIDETEMRLTLQLDPNRDPSPMNAGQRMSR